MQPRPRTTDEHAGASLAAPPLHSPCALRRHGGLRHPRLRRGDPHLALARARRRGTGAGPAAGASPIRLRELALRRHCLLQAERRERVRRHHVPRRRAHDRTGRAQRGSADGVRRVDEIIVVNDGSRDGSEVVLERLAGEIEKLRIIETPGLGQSAARNRALREAKGELIAILDGDDFWTPEKLARQLPAFARSGRSASFMAISSISLAMTRRTAASSRCAASIPKARTSFATTSCTTGRSCRPRLSSAAPFSMMSASSTSPFASARTPNSVCASRKSGGFATCRAPSLSSVGISGQLSWRLDALLPSAVLVTQQFSSHHPELTVSCRPSNGAAPCEGQCRLCDEGRMAQSPPSQPHGDPPRAALLACLGQPGAFARATSVVRPFYEGLKGLACAATVVVFRLTMLVLASTASCLPPGQAMPLVAKRRLPVRAE